MVLVARGPAGERELRSSAVRHGTPDAGSLAEVGHGLPRPGETIRVPLGAMRMVETAGGRLQWRVEEPRDVGAFL